MILGLVGRDLAGLDQMANLGVIAGQHFDAPVGEAVDPAVSPTQKQTALPPTA
jgi:hypothetical protein